MAKDWEQLAQGRLARGKGRLRSSRLEPWPAALGAGWFKVHAGLAIAVCVMAGPASTCRIRLGLSLPDRLPAGKPCRRRNWKGDPAWKVHDDLTSVKYGAL